MYKKQNNGGLNNIKKVMTTFGVLGMLVVGLGVVSMTQMATEQKTETTADASYFSCQEYQLTTIYYRGNQGFVRNTPIVNGAEQWNQSEPFRMIVDLNANPTAHPGSGEMKGINLSSSEGTYVSYEIIRGDHAYYKYFANSLIGQVDWAKEAKTGWSDNGGGYGGWQALNEVAIIKSDVDTYTKYFYGNMYIDNKGYTSKGYSVNNNLTRKTISSDNVNALVDIDNKSVVIDLNTNPTALPGSGPIQAIGDYVNQNNTVLNQSWFRGNVQYGRQVPIRDYKPDYKSATPIKVDMDLNANPTALPGKGAMQAITKFINCKR